MKSPIGIVMGRGALPKLLCAHLKRKKTPFVLFPIVGQADPASVEGHPHDWVHFGKINKNILLFKEHRIQRLVFAGYVKRPGFALLRLDIKGIIWLSQIVLKFFKDDALLSTIVRLFEREGFEVLGAQQVMPELLMPVGVLGKVRPSERDLESIRVGVEAAKAHGQQDKGQGVIVRGTEILAKETMQGTNVMLERTAQAEDVADAILVKVMKPQQEKRVDLPTIGTETVEKLATYGYKGVSLEAGCGLILEKEKVIRKANEKNIFVYGYKNKS